MKFVFQLGDAYSDNYMFTIEANTEKEARRISSSNPDILQMADILDEDIDSARLIRNVE